MRVEESILPGSFLTAAQSKLILLLFLIQKLSLIAALLVIRKHCLLINLIKLIKLTQPTQQFNLAGFKEKLTLIVLASSPIPLSAFILLLI